MKITFDSAEKLETEILITVTVDGVMGRKVVPFGSDLKVEAELLAAEIAAPMEVEKVAKAPEHIDVSKIVLEVKTLEDAKEAEKESIDETIKSHEQNTNMEEETNEETMTAEEVILEAEAVEEAAEVAEEKAEEMGGAGLAEAKADEADRERGEEI